METAPGVVPPMPRVMDICRVPSERLITCLIWLKKGPSFGRAIPLVQALLLLADCSTPPEHLEGCLAFQGDNQPIEGAVASSNRVYIFVRGAAGDRRVEAASDRSTH